jgi:hypothetical protein
MIEKAEFTAHQEYQLALFNGVYEYDPADDGPECEIITRILASHPELAREAQ